MPSAISGISVPLLLDSRKMQHLTISTAFLSSPPLSKNCASGCDRQPEKIVQWLQCHQTLGLMKATQQSLFYKKLFQILGSDLKITTSVGKLMSPKSREYFWLELFLIMEEENCFFFISKCYNKILCTFNNNSSRISFPRDAGGLKQFIFS